MSVKHILNPKNLQRIAEQVAAELEDLPFIILIDTPPPYKQNISLHNIGTHEDIKEVLKEAYDSFSSKPDTQDLNGFHSN